MNRKLSASEAVKFLKCGGYQGVRKPGAPELSPQETSFGVYCYALCEIVRDVYHFNFNNKDENHAYIQGEMQATIPMLEAIASTYIDEENMRVDYDGALFSRMYASNHRLTNIQNLMPNVIHMVALQKGLELENENLLIDDAYSPTSLHSSLKRSKIYSIEELKSSVQQKFDNANEKL